MDTITFQTIISDEQVIRPPVDVHLPQGPMEVTIRSVNNSAKPNDVKLANESLRNFRVTSGQAIGIDNAGIDADLARIYGEDGVPATRKP